MCTSSYKSAVSSALLLLLAALPARAGDIVHTVKSGETLETLAKHYYGETWKAVYVAAKNDIEPGKGPKSGARLTIPACWIYKVKRGDSAASIAKRYLGDSERYQALMTQNGLKDPLELQPGLELLMPFHVTYPAQKNDSWSNISKRFYRSTKNADLLRTYNGGTAEPASGQRVTVPVFDRASVTSRDRGIPGAPAIAAVVTPSVAAPAPAPVEKAEDGKTSSKARSRLKSGIASYHDGDFDGACSALEDLLGESEMALGDRATLIRYLGFCSIAFGDTDAACDYFEKWIEIEPSASLDPVTTSPKILAVFRDAADGDCE